MATNTETGRHAWPFMSLALSEAAAVRPEAWAALQPRVNRMCRTHTPRTPNYALQSQDCEQRGQAVLDAAVKTLISKHTH